MANAACGHQPSQDECLTEEAEVQAPCQSCAIGETALCGWRASRQIVVCSVGLSGPEAEHGRPSRNER